MHESLPGRAFLAMYMKKKCSLKKKQHTLVPTEQCSQTFNCANVSSAMTTTYLWQETVHKFPNVDVSSVTTISTAWKMSPM